MDKKPEIGTYEYNKEYAKKWDAKFDKLLLRIHAGQKDVWREEATKAGESLNQYVIRAVEERMRKE